MEVKGFRTVVFGIAIAGISILSNAEMQAWIAEHLPYLGGMAGTLIIVLRAFTSSPIFKKDA